LPGESSGSAALLRKSDVVGLAPLHLVGTRAPRSEALMSSVHTITAEIEARFTFPGLADGEHETAYPTVEIQYAFVRGYPATGPSYSCAGEPGAPDEVDLISARLIKADGLTPTEDQIHDWAREWLHGEGYAEACAYATQGPDPDDLLQQRRDEEDFPLEPFDEGF